MEHRAGWDATFSTPKPVSLTALVGGDDNVRTAHRESVHVEQLEHYTYTLPSLAPATRPPYFADDMTKLNPQLSTDTSKTSALEVSQASFAAQGLGMD